MLSILVGIDAHEAQSARGHCSDQQREFQHNLGGGPPHWGHQLHCCTVLSNRLPAYKPQNLLQSATYYITLSHTGTAAALLLVCPVTLLPSVRTYSHCAMGRPSILVQSACSGMEENMPCHEKGLNLWNQFAARDDIAHLMPGHFLLASK